MELSVRPVVEISAPVVLMLPEPFAFTDTDVASPPNKPLIVLFSAIAELLLPVASVTLLAFSGATSVRTPAPAVTRVRVKLNILPFEARRLALLPVSFMKTLPEVLAETFNALVVMLLPRPSAPIFPKSDVKFRSVALIDVAPFLLMLPPLVVAKLAVVACKSLSKRAPPAVKLKELTLAEPLLFNVTASDSDK